MQQRLRTIWRKSTLRKNTKTPQHEHAHVEETSPPANSYDADSDTKDSTSAPDPPEGPHHCQDFSDPLQGGAAPSPCKGAIATTDYGMVSPTNVDEPAPSEPDAYFPVVNHKGDVSSSLKYMSLGGDSRHRTGASEMRHNEDIADRNIIMYGSTSPRGSIQSLGTPRGSIQGLSAAASLKSGDDLTTKTLDEDPIGSDLNARRGSLGNLSGGSVGSPGSMASVASIAKYALGTGIPTEGGLIDRILPHKETGFEPKYRREDWPHRVARDDTGRTWNRRKTTGDQQRKSPPLKRSSLPESTYLVEGEDMTAKRDAGTIDIKTALFDGSGEPGCGNGGFVMRNGGVVDASNTSDVEKLTRFAPVTHQVIKPHEHHVREERIYREVHNHDYYHRVQPVQETEFLPARHFIHDKHGQIVEIPADEAPDCDGEFQTLYLDKKAAAADSTPSRLSRITEPTVVADTSYMTPEGYERRETTIVHPPELEDMSSYGGPVVPIDFAHNPYPVRGGEMTMENLPRNTGGAKRASSEELGDVLPGIDSRVNNSFAVDSR